MSGEYQVLNIAKEFRQNIFPAVLGACGLGVYYLSDGLFVGNQVGDDGLSAISITWTMVTFLIAVSVAIGMGGSIRYSIALGRKDKRETSEYFTVTVVVLLVFGLVLTLVFGLFSDSILRLLGAVGAAYELSVVYLRPIVYCTAFQVLAYGLIPVVRNIGGYKVASWAMAGGYIVNILLDYLLMVVLTWGMLGASLAYICGQIVIAVICLLYIIGHSRTEYSYFSIKSLRWRRTISGLLASAVAPFGLHFTFNIVSIFINRAFLRHGGSASLAGYMVIMSTVAMITTINGGILGGSQPLLSRYFGEDKPEVTSALVRMMFSASMGLYISCGLVVVLARSRVGPLFGVSEIVALEVARRLPLCILGYLFAGVARTITTYLYATDNNLLAGVLTYGESVLFIMALLILPEVWGIEGIWRSMFLVYTIIAITSLGFMKLKNIERRG